MREAAKPHMKDDVYRFQYKQLSKESRAMLTYGEIMYAAREGVNDRATEEDRRRCLVIAKTTRSTSKLCALK